jgi:hypothetical protein
MSLTISTIRDAVKAQLNANLAGGPQRQVTIDAHGDGAPAPVIRLELAPSEPIDYWLTMSPNGAEVGGLSEIRFDLIVDVAGIDGSAVRRLDDFLSVGTGNGESVIDALLADKSLGGVVETIHVSGVSEYDALNVTATLPLRVVCRKSGANS